MAFAVAARVYGLGRLPGVNGDEAWYGAQSLQILSGGPFDWRTPNGNLPGPLHLALLTALHAVASPSLALLRVPSVLSSLAQCALTWLVVRRWFGAGAAAIALVLTALLPIEVAYARFGWDPSHSGLVAIVAAHLALSGSPFGTAAAFALGLAVHPTNVFLAPFLVLAFAGAEAGRTGWRRALRRTAALVALLLCALPLLAWTSSPGLAASDVGSFRTVGTRLVSPSYWLEFATLYLRLLTGDSTLAYVTGEGLGQARLPAELAVGALLVVLATLGVRRLRAAAASAAAGIVAGWLVSLLVFAVLGGPGAIAPGVERYAIWVVVPTVLAVTVLLRELAGGGTRWNRALAVTATIAAASALAIVVCYFGVMERGGAPAHATFWTGPREPKGEAFRLVEGEARERGGARLVAENYWIYWPAAYLAHGGPVEVRYPAQVSGASPPGGTYWVAFAGGPLDRWASTAPLVLERWRIPAAGGRFALRVWWTPPNVMIVPAGEPAR
jgi:hypothetical protein